MENTRRKKKVNKGKIIKIVIICVVVAAILAVGIIFLRKYITNEYGSTDTASVLSAEVTSGSISTTVYGSGMLVDEDSSEYEIPSGVELETVYVSVGDEVNEGDALASVNTASVVTAMSDAQNELDELDEEIEDASDESVSDTVSASVSGRVKKIFAEEGDDVATVMYENGALALISLDGYMAVDVTTDALAVNDEVTVICSDSSEYEGTVSDVLNGVATVLVTDNGPEYGDGVTVVASDGSEVGSGELYINEPLSVNGYAGTINSVSVSENTKVASGKTIFKLTDTSYTANYEALLKEREELEDTLEKLIKIYKEGAIYAELSGTVKEIPDVEETSSQTSSSSSQSVQQSMAAFASSSSSSSTSTESEVFGICPDEYMEISLSVDESDILSLSKGLDAVVEIDSLGDDTYTGTVTEIDKSGSYSNGVTTYTVTVSIEKSEGMIAGMSASASIVINSVENTLLIPVDALNKTRETSYVYTSYNEEDGTFGDMKEVTTGLENSSYVEIVSGLEEGETVYYTESTDSTQSFEMPGGMSGFGGGGMPDMGGGMSQGGGMPDMGGGNAPSGMGGKG